MAINRSLFALALGLGLALPGCGSSGPPATAHAGGVATRALERTGGAASESDGDLAITHQIHDAVRRDPSLSPVARRVTIVTLGAVVTLRGSVTSNRERDVIARHAREVAGVLRIDNALSVGGSPND